MSFTDLDPKVEAELQRLAERDGGLLKAEAVVREAAKKKSPLHGMFTWDDTDAARRWRLHEAGKLIRKVKIIITKEPDTVSHVRAYVSVTHEGERGYMKVERALVEHRDQVLERALLELEQMRRRYDSLVDFDEVLRRALTSKV